MSDSNRGAILACLAVVGTLALFCGKAFTIDDTLFLQLAAQLRADPFDFYGFQVNWYGSSLPMHEVTKNPPLVGYYLAAVMSLFGPGEVALHLAFLLPAAGVAFTTHRLAERLCGQPLLATLAGLLTPVFLVSSSNVMSDTPMLAFWCASVLCWLRGFDRSRQRWLWAAAGLACLAFLSKYFGLALVPLLLVHGRLRAGRLGRWALPLSLPLATALAYQLLTAYLGYGSAGRGLLLEAASYHTGYPEEAHIDFATRAVIGLYFAGGCLLPALCFAPLLWARVMWIAGLVLVGLAVLTSGPDPTLRILQGQAVLLSLAGTSLLALVVAEGWRSRREPEAWLLSLWLAGTFVFASQLNWVNNGRSNLAMAPAFGIVLVRRLDALGVGRGRRIAALIPSIAAALAVAHGDYRWAGSVRDVARELTASHAATDGTLWFQGHWGFQHYMEQGGARAFDLERDRLEPGDWMVLPDNNVDVYPPPAGREWGDTLEIEAPDPGWVHLTKPELGASFYASNVGILPFVFGPAQPDRYRVFRARRSFQIDVTDPHHAQGPRRREPAPDR